MEMELCYYAGFLYGVNIPRGVCISPTDLQSQLKNIDQDIRFVGFVNDSDNLIFESKSATCDERLLRKTLRQRLGVDSVVLSWATMLKVVSEATAHLKSIGYPIDTPYRIIRNSQEWELGVVLLSENLPTSMHGSATLFSSRKNAIALKVIAGCGLLVEKRCRTDGGKQSRITWGSTVIRPWRMTLLHHNFWTEDQCLTSRALGTMKSMVAKIASKRPRNIRNPAEV